jgi:hypothetical protein
VIQVEHKGDFWVEPVCILDQKVKVLRNKAMGLVKVQCTCYGPEDATWEHEETMREEYPQNFNNFKDNKIFECKTAFWAAKILEPHLIFLLNLHRGP